MACGQPQLASAPAPWMEKKLVSEAHLENPHVHQEGGTLFGLLAVERAARSWPVRLEGGKCYFVSAVGDETVEELDLQLRASKEELVKPRSQKGSAAILSFCPTAAGVYTVQAYARRGAGHVAVGVFEREPTKDEDNANILADAVDAHARRTARGFARIGPAYRSTSARAEWTVELVERHCYAFVGEGSGKVTALGLKLVNSAGDVVASADPTAPTVEIRYCTGAEKALYKLKAASPSGAGEYFVGVFAGKKE